MSNNHILLSLSLYKIHPLMISLLKHPKYILETYDQMKTHNEEYLNVGTICMKIRLQFLLLNTGTIFQPISETAIV